MTATRGRYAARSPLPRRLLAFTAMLAFLAALGLAGASAARADGYVADPYYNGVRFVGTLMCVDDRTINPTTQAAVLDSVRDYQRNTSLRMFYQRGRGACDSFDYEIVVFARNLGATSWLSRIETAACSETRTRQCYEWGSTENGGATWVHRDYAVVMLNSYYRGSGSGHVIRHEIGHLVGLSHRTDTCKSVMSTRDCWSGGFLSGGSNGDVGVVNRIYAQ